MKRQYTPQELEAAHDRGADALNRKSADEIEQGLANYGLLFGEGHRTFAETIDKLTRPTCDRHLKLDSSMADVYVMAATMWVMGFATAMELPPLEADDAPASA